MMATRAEPVRQDGVVLITGAAGRIGRLLRRALPLDPAVIQHYGGPVRLRVTDVVEPGLGIGADEVSAGNLADAGFVDSLFADGRVEAVIHLAGCPREADWDVLLDANIRSSIHVWEAARRAGTDRVLFGALIEVVGYFPVAVLTPLAATLAVPRVRWREAVLVAVLLGLGTSLLFVILLGQPLKLWWGAE